MVFCFVERLGAGGRVTIGIGLSRALQYGGGIRIGLALGVAHSLGRRLVMKLRLDGLGSGWAAFCAGRCVPDLSLKLLDLRCAWPAMGSAAAAKQSGSGRRDEEAE